MIRGGNWASGVCVGSAKGSRSAVGIKGNLKPWRESRSEARLEGGH